mgnify:CR=1 FL=1
MRGRWGLVVGLPFFEGVVEEEWWWWRCGRRGREKLKLEWRDAMAFRRGVSWLCGREFRRCYCIGVESAEARREA